MLEADVRNDSPGGLLGPSERRRANEVQMRGRITVRRRTVVSPCLDNLCVFCLELRKCDDLGRHARTVLREASVFTFHASLSA